MFTGLFQHEGSTSPYGNTPIKKSASNHAIYRYNILAGFSMTGVGLNIQGELYRIQLSVKVMRLWPTENWKEIAACGLHRNHLMKIQGKYCYSWMFRSANLYLAYTSKVCTPVCTFFYTFKRNQGFGYTTNPTERRRACSPSMLGDAWWD